MGVRKKTSKVVENWVAIKYDYVPKYCKTCKLQGHNENEFLTFSRSYTLENRRKVILESRQGKRRKNWKEDLKGKKKWWSIKGILGMTKPII